MNINNKDNNNQIRDKRFNDFLATNLDATIEDRYCQRCHFKMVHNPRNSPYDTYLYSCPACNCTADIHNTEPTEKLVTTFPTHNATTGDSGGKKLVTQPDSQRLSRSQYFIQKQLQKKTEVENNDPYLAMLKKNNKITITNIDYSEPNEG
jgi:hypothetical protein